MTYETLRRAWHQSGPTPGGWLAVAVAMPLFLLAATSAVKPLAVLQSFNGLFHALAG